jgi:hypothetical protein
MRRATLTVGGIALGVGVGAAATALGGSLLGTGAAIAAPLAGSFSLVLATPAVPAARTRAVLGGYAAAVVAGLATAAVLGTGAVSVTGLWSDIAAVVLGAGLTVALMRPLDAFHPPAAAAGCLIALQPLRDWPVALVLLLAGGAVAACAIAVRARVRSTA